MSADRAALALAALAWLATACAHSGGTQGGGGAEPDAEVVALAGALAGLDAAVDAGEARLAAQTALAATRELADVYRMTWPPQLHNALVNSGLRERGLCCHWAEDMAARLRALDLRTLDVHWVVAHRGSRLREHNSPLLAPRGAAVERGLVLDGWRRAGALVWARPGEDTYPWVPHPLDGEWDRLRCAD